MDVRNRLYRYIFMKFSINHFNNSEVNIQLWRVNNVVSIHTNILLLFYTMVDGNKQVSSSVVLMRRVFKSFILGGFDGSVFVTAYSVHNMLGHTGRSHSRVLLLLKIIFPKWLLITYNSELLNTSCRFLGIWSVKTDSPELHTFRQDRNWKQIFFWRGGLTLIILKT